MNAQSDVSGEARAALASVDEMKSTINRRSEWPFWLILVVAACFGVIGGIRFYFGPGTSFLFESGVFLACMGTAATLYLLHFRSRGLMPHDGFRWLTAILVNAVFVVNAISTNGQEVTRSFSEAMGYGTLVTLTILLIWASGFGFLWAFRSFRRYARVRNRG